MSREIKAKTSVTISEEEAPWKNGDRERKLLFTTYRNRNCALLMQSRRLIAASFFSDKPGKIGAVYIGRVRNMVKNIDACFVEIAKGEICFLPLKNAEFPYLLNRAYDGRILEGDELPVQMVRDAQKTKRASVTAHVSMANDYFAISLGSARVGYSSKLDAERKKTLKNLLMEHSILDPSDNGRLAQSIAVLLSGEEKARIRGEGLYPASFILPSMGLVVRTRAGEVKESEELLGYFYDISAKFIRLLYTAMYRKCFSCLKEADAGFEAVIKEYAVNWNMPALVSPITEESQAPLVREADQAELAENTEIITDQESMYGQIKKYCEDNHAALNVRLYTDSLLSLSSLYSVQAKMEEALGSRVWLKSGGYLVIESTEALTVIDVNSGKCGTDKSARENFRKINMEAAGEVALQLRLRNLSGIIIVDFINMNSGADNAQLMNYLRTLVKQDNVMTTVVDMTPLGLVEITRKKISKSLKEQFADAVCANSFSC